MTESGIAASVLHIAASLQLRKYLVRDGARDVNGRDFVRFLLLPRRLPSGVERLKKKTNALGLQMNCEPNCEPERIKLVDARITSSR
ncbi:MAG TPA: hypothetical protein VF573_18615 [Paraburkholderia sp.]|uniref:hypothetical protein n=1 Tax=Paraburkholderia sp. TaxID=1926495 RepID=UPI002ED125E1